MYRQESESYQALMTKSMQTQLRYKSSINYIDNLYIYTGWNDKIVVLKKTFIEKINSSNLIM